MPRSAAARVVSALHAHTLNIVHVWDADYPWDVRVQKVSSALVSAGHAVHIVARNRKRQATREVLPEGTIHRLPPWKLLPAAADRAAMFPAFFNPRWLAAISRTVSATHADLILVRDLPLAPTALHVARRRNIPVVLDMAENYGAMMQALWDNGVQRPLDFIVRNPAIVRRLERWVLSKADHVTVVVEESGERLERLGYPASRISVVGNTPDKRRLLDFTERTTGTSGELRIVYLGLLEKPRGVETVLRAVAISRRRGAKVSLEVIGDGRERGAFENLARELGLTADVVRFRGFVPYQTALEAFRTADAGIVPHFANESWNTTIPNKLFDYMSAGLPVLTSNAIPAARVVRETRAGLVYAFDDPEDLARQFNLLLDAELRLQMGAAGRAAVRDRYNWELDANRLSRAIESAVSNRR